MTTSIGYSKYLPPDKMAQQWGLHVLDAGHASISKGQEYPIKEEHPEDYVFEWENGRIIDEYQLVYITKGKGIFENKQGKQEVKAGDCMILFPDTWHRYKPLEDSGWDETWVGFSGDHADRVIGGYFNAEKTVFNIGFDEGFFSGLISIGDTIRSRPAGYRQLVAAETLLSLARFRSLVMRQDSLSHEHSDKIDAARYHLLQHATTEINFEELAATLGYSYSRFRGLFRQHVGTSPLQYQLGIRLNWAKARLRDSEQSISEIADELGFSSLYYFSRMFKKHTSITPSDYRKGIAEQVGL